jgi:anti-sigma factor (TIGR02949 family)
MDCKEAELLLHEYLDCNMCEDGRLKIQAHLNSCPKCNGKFNFEQGLREMVKKCSKAELPSDLCSRISKMLDCEKNSDLRA